MFDILSHSHSTTAPPFISGILVRASKNKDGGGYSYNTTIAVFVTEWVKITVAIILYIKE